MCKENKQKNFDLYAAYLNDSQIDDNTIKNVDNRLFIKYISSDVTGIPFVDWKMEEMKRHIESRKKLYDKGVRTLADFINFAIKKDN